ncbi:MAG: FAD-linked oxidase C-terminal domain-containing protein [Deltaproteobacteria bacterium]|nr:FAD-linked oxidase C-terminal domain-containing protein [Deltaproteobacteria bacterium]
MTSYARCLLALESALGPSTAVTDASHCLAHARDESETETVQPLAVVHARDARDVVTALRVCNLHEVPVVPRGGATGRVGGAAVVVPSVVLDLSRMSQLKELTQQDQYAVVEPGMLTSTLHTQVEAEGLFYPPDPQSAQWCTLGGNVATNAGGPRALKYGVTREYVLGARAVLMDGTELTVGRRTRKGVTGYDLTALLVGSEGTLAVLTELTLRVVTLPERVVTLLATFASTDDAVLASNAVMRAGLLPRCVELLDEHCCRAILAMAPSALPAHARAVLLIELDGDEAHCAQQLERCGNVLSARADEVLVAQHGGERDRLWSARSVMSRALRAMANHKLSEDVVVPRSGLTALLNSVSEISAREGISMPTYGHVGDGNLHVNLLWNDPAQSPAVERAITALFERTVSLGGTLSGEHGLGVLKRDFLSLEQSAEVIETQRAVKRALDAKGLLNPHKKLPRGGHSGC